MVHMRAPRTVATLTADVPFRHLFGLNVVVDRMAAIAGWARGALHVVGRIERGPPIRSVRDHVGAPDFVGDVPLRRLGKIVIADLREIALLPDASVDEGDLILREFLAYIIGGQVGSDGVGMFFGIADDVGHRRFLPVLVDLRVAFLACRGADVMRRGRRCYLLDSLLWRQLRYGANEKNNFPGAVVVLSNVRGSQGRHAREAHSVLDDVVDFAVS